LSRPSVVFSWNCYCLHTAILSFYTARVATNDTRPVKSSWNVNWIWKWYYWGGPPLWSSGQSSWLQIRRPGFDSRHYKKKKWVWNGVHSASWVQLRSYLTEK
jgi:hypothetical protein